ncbi:hypothetical protein NLX71_26040 [Paenibacillus sp. MZ04-78.2]|uniref:hypothetical protein n=1 Tax=Paenibacillus sp. MZ04-78.2 TaxID=2962034 RepID=UPI0020B6F61E|nr:hypothetical protein [Paenibacillus sp. MZ04-78.2]MCP3776703.1 hypothetical protein [Paenibacillus sp. MZ04-78.2]
MIPEQQRLEMYGDMSQEEIDMIYWHQGKYKGWDCIETGFGLLVMRKGFEELRAFRGLEVKNWIPECWKELKQKIDELET